MAEVDLEGVTVGVRTHIKAHLHIHYNEPVLCGASVRARQRFIESSGRVIFMGVDLAFFLFPLGVT